MVTQVGFYGRNDPTASQTCACFITWDARNSNVKSDVMLDLALLIGICSKWESVSSLPLVIWCAMLVCQRAQLHPSICKCSTIFVWGEGAFGGDATTSTLSDLWSESRLWWSFYACFYQLILSFIPGLESVYLWTLEWVGMSQRLCVS